MWKLLTADIGVLTADICPATADIALVTADICPATADIRGLTADIAFAARAAYSFLPH